MKNGRYVISLTFLVILFLSHSSLAGEIRTPVYPAHFEESGYRITGKDAPSVLRSHDVLYIDPSDGFRIDSDHFYYASLNSNGKTDYLGTEYTIQKMDQIALLLKEVWDREEINVYQNKTLAIAEGYTLELADAEESNKVNLILKLDGNPVKSDILSPDSEFKYSQKVAGEDVEIFSATVSNIFISDDAKKIVLEKAFLNKIKVITDGETLGNDYVVNLEDIDTDGDMDIVVKLEDKKTISLIKGETTPILDGFLSIKCDMFKNQFYKDLEKYPLIATDNKYNVYSANQGSVSTNVSDFLQRPPSGSLIAIGPTVNINTKVSPVTNKSESLTVDRVIRGHHTFYTYVDREDLNLTITKQDLNWYEGPDILDIKIYTDDGEEINSYTVNDDGNSQRNYKIGPLQAYNILLSDVEPGLYKIVLNGGIDFYINYLATEQDKLIVDKYIFVMSPQAIYTEARRNQILKFLTYHDSASQNITITNDVTTLHVNVNQPSKWFEINLPSSDTPYKISIPKGDMIVESSSYLAFTEDSFFNPIACEVIPLKNSLEWIESKQIDYIVIPAEEKQLGFYAFKETGSQYEVKSPISSEDVYITDSWTNPSIFYFDFNNYATRERLYLKDTGTGIIDKNSFSYESIQTPTYSENTFQDWSLAYFGKPYHILSIDSNEAILSPKLINNLEVTVTTDKPLKLEKGYSFVLEEIDVKGESASLSLKKDQKTFQNMVLQEGDVFSWNKSIEQKEVTLFNAQVESVFYSNSTAAVKLSEVNQIDDSTLVIKTGDRIGAEYIIELIDINNDRKTDLKVRLEKDRTLPLKKGSKRPILGGFLNLVVEENGRFYFSREIGLTNTIPVEYDTSNIKSEEQYVITWLLPSEEASLDFEKSDIRNVEVHFKQEQKSVYAMTQELNQLPTDVTHIGDDKEIIHIYNISIKPKEIVDATIKFRCEKALLSESRYTKDDVRLLVYNNDDWTSLDVTFEYEDNKFLYFSSRATTLPLFAVCTEKSDGEIPLVLSEINRKMTPNASSTETKLFKIRHSLLVYFILIFTVVAGSVAFIKKDKLKTFSIQPNKTFRIEKIIDFNKNLFFSLFVSYLILSLVEKLWESSVSSHLNLNQLLGALIGVGLLFVLTSQEEKLSMLKAGTNNKQDYAIITLAGLSSALIILNQISRLGTTSYSIALLSGTLLILILIVEKVKKEIQK